MGRERSVRQLLDEVLAEPRLTVRERVARMERGMQDLGRMRRKHNVASFRSEWHSSRAVVMSDILIASVHGLRSGKCAGPCPHPRAKIESCWMESTAAPACDNSKLSLTSQGRGVRTERMPDEPFWTGAAAKEIKPKSRRASIRHSIAKRLGKGLNRPFIVVPKTRAREQEEPFARKKHFFGFSLNKSLGQTGRQRVTCWMRRRGHRRRNDGLAHDAGDGSFMMTMAQAQEEARIDITAAARQTPRQASQKDPSRRRSRRGALIEPDVLADLRAKYKHLALYFEPVGHSSLDPQASTGSHALQKPPSEHHDPDLSDNAMRVDAIGNETTSFSFEIASTTQTAGVAALSEASTGSFYSIRSDSSEATILDDDDSEGSDCNEEGKMGLSGAIGLLFSALSHHAA